MPYTATWEGTRKYAERTTRRLNPDRMRLHKERAEIQRIEHDVARSLADLAESRGVLVAFAQAFAAAADFEAVGRKIKAQMTAFHTTPAPAVFPTYSPDFSGERIGLNRRSFNPDGPKVRADRDPCTCEAGYDPGCVSHGPSAPRFEVRVASPEPFPRFPRLPGPDVPPEVSEARGAAAGCHGDPSWVGPILRGVVDAPEYLR